MKLLLSQQNDEAVGKDSHPNEEVRKGQPVSCTPDFPHPAVVSIE